MPAVSQRAYTLEISVPTGSAWTGGTEVFTTQKAQLSRARELLATWMQRRRRGLLEGYKGSLRSGFASVGECSIQLHTFTDPPTVKRLLLADQRRELA